MCAPPPPGPRAQCLSMEGLWESVGPSGDAVMTAVQGAVDVRQPALCAACYTTSEPYFHGHKKHEVMPALLKHTLCGDSFTVLENYVSGSSTACGIGPPSPQRPAWAATPGQNGAGVLNTPGRTLKAKHFRRARESWRSLTFINISHFCYSVLRICYTLRFITKTAYRNDLGFYSHFSTLL